MARRSRACSCTKEAMTTILAIPAGAPRAAFCSASGTFGAGAIPACPADVWRAPQDQVAAIYRQNYWNALRCDDLPAGVDYAVFDYGVNSGIGRAAKVLQRLVATAMDGEVGPETIAAAKRAK